jgi:hypothetical protein
MKAKILVLGLLFLSLSLLCLQFEGEEKLPKIEQKIKAISDKTISELFSTTNLAIFDKEPVAKYIKIPVVEDDGSMYRIWVVFLVEPRNYDQVQPWTNAVCRAAKRILDNNGVVRDVEVWAIRIIGFSWEEGGVLFYGRTFYDHDTDKFEFKNIRKLNYRKGK